MGRSYGRTQLRPHPERKLPRLGCLLIVAAALALVGGCMAVIVIVGQQEEEKEQEEKERRIVQAVPGAVAEAEGVRVTLHEVVDPWVEEGLFEAPQPGTRYVAIRVSLENVGDGDHALYSSNFDLKTSSYDGEVTFFKAEPDLFAPGPFLNLSSGARAEGWVTFVVAEGAGLTMLKYDPSLVTTNDVEFHWE